MKNSVRIISVLCVLLICIFVFASCDAGSSYDSEIGMPETSINSNTGNLNGILNNGSAVKPETDSSNSENNDTTDESDYESKIIKKYWMETETKEFDDSIAKLEALINSANGYTESSSVTGFPMDDGKARPV